MPTSITFLAVIMKLFAFVPVLLTATIGVKAQIQSPPLLESIINVTITVDPEVIGPLLVPGGTQTGMLVYLHLAT